MTGVGSTVDITALERDGFLVVDQLVAGADLERLRAAYDEVIDQRVLAPGDRYLGGLIRQVMVPSAVHPVFADNPALRRVLEILGAVLPGPARTFDMLIYKPPGDPNETPWHQDMAYAHEPVARAGTPNDRPNVQVWIAMDDVDEENGCMHFVPGIHRAPLVEHRVAAGDPADQGRLLEISDLADVDLSTAVACPLRAGGATMHLSGTPHYTPANRSADRPRRAYIVNVGPTA
jgi:hypothetical protein